MKGIFIFLSLLCVSSLADNVYNNPVLTGPEGVADPFVLKYNGEYYLYTTTLRVYHSYDLVTWDYYRDILSPNASSWNQCDVWAPEVMYDNGVFYMYYTASLCSQDFLTNELNRRIGVATSLSPIDPFTDSGKPISDYWGIDAHFFKDPDTGGKYLFMSYLYEYMTNVAPSMGTGISVDQFTSWNTIANKPDAVTRGSETDEDKDGDWANGSLRFTNEGPTVIKRKGEYFLIFSHGSWDMPSYALSYATSQNVQSGQGVWGPTWAKESPPFLKSNAFVNGPGHNSIVKAPNNVDDICVNHGRVNPFQNVGQRYVFIDRLYYNDYRLHMNLPSTAVLPAPDQPLFSDIFNRPDSDNLGSYKVVSGNWSVRAQQAQQSNIEGVAAVIIVSTAPVLTDYLFEANIQFLLPQGEVGIYLWLKDTTSNYITASITSVNETYSIIVRAVLENSQYPEQVVALPQNFKPTVYHQILATKSSNLIFVSVDGVKYITYEIDPSFLKTTPLASAGLFTSSTSAAFDGLAITSYFEDRFNNGFLWQAPTFSSGGSIGGWQIIDNILVQNELSGTDNSNIYSIYRGQPSTFYEFSADVMLENINATDGTVGIVAAVSENQIVLAGFNKNIWPMGSFIVSFIDSASGITQNFTATLPRGFLFNIYHNIRVVRQGNLFSFFLDSKETIDVNLIFNEASIVGLYTSTIVRASVDYTFYKWTTTPQNLIGNGGFEDEQNDGASPYAGNLWEFEGSASFTPSSPYAGIRKVNVATGTGMISQTLTITDPGDYTLTAYTQNAYYKVQSCYIFFSVSGGNNETYPCEGESWRKTEIVVSLSSPSQVITIGWQANVTDLPVGSVASVDEFYLRKN